MARRFSARTHFLRAALLASTALVVCADQAVAVDATWNLNGTGNYNTAANWTPGTVPDGTAFFGVSNQAAVVVPTSNAAGGWTFDAGASAYTFTLALNFAFNGAGIVINGGSAALTNPLGTLQFLNSSTAGAATINNSSILTFFGTSTAGNAVIASSVTGSLNFNDTSTAANASITDSGNVNFNNFSTAANATIANNSFNMNFNNFSTAANASITNNGTLNFNNSSTAGNATITNSFSLNFKDSSTAGNATITNAGGSLNFINGSTAGSAAITNDNGTLDFENNSTAGSAAITNNAGSVLRFFNTSTAGSAAITNNGGATVDFSGSSGPAGDNRLTAGSIAGAGSYVLGINELTVGGNNLSTEVSGAIVGTGSLVKVGTGTLTLSGTNIYTGPTTVNAGALIVNGSIALSSLTTVNSGAALLGSGRVGLTVINSGGFLVPGPVGTPGMMTVTGNLAFQSGAFYIVQVNPTTAASSNVSGTASLAGTVGAIFLPGTYLQRSYPILTAAGGLAGTFNTLTTLGLPASFQTSLSYIGNTAFLNLRAGFVPEPPTPMPSPPIPPVPGLPPLPEPPPLPAFTINQLNVGHAIDNFFNNSGALPPAFGSLFGLTGNNLTRALDQLSGEAATGMQQSSFLSGGMFLNAMLDPFVEGRGGGFGSAMGYAPERKVSGDAASAFAAYLKAPPKQSIVDERWGVWGASYGGYNRTDGDPVVVGSHDLTARTGGFAAGADYRYAPGSVLGAAVAIGETNWGLSSGLGKGNSDVAQVGGYASTRWNDMYLSAAVAGAWYNAKTDRFVGIAGLDHLRGDFDAHSVSARAETGWRFGTTALGFTPYAAVQVQSVSTPAYGEAAVSGSNVFALNYRADTVTDTRTELGGWVDTRHALDNGASVLLRGRAAWVHDFNPDRRAGALFQTLPGAGFTVNGAGAAEDAALVSAAAELRLTNGVSLTAKFDGEFAGGSQTYAGTGTIRYAW